VPADVSFLSSAYFIYAGAGVTQLEPLSAASVTLTFPYNPADIQADPGRTAGNLAVAYFNGTQWIILAASVNTTNSTVTTVTNHLSWWAVVLRGNATATPTLTGTPTYPSSLGPQGLFLGANILHSLSGETLNIQYGAAGAGTAIINIYNANGSIIRHLINQTVTQGPQNFYWDGKDDNGSPASTGLYLVMARQPGGAVVIKKVVVLKQ
jgi:hypothetical protein